MIFVIAKLCYPLRNCHHGWQLIANPGLPIWFRETGIAPDHSTSDFFQRSTRKYPAMSEQANIYQHIAPQNRSVA